MVRSSSLISTRVMTYMIAVVLGLLLSQAAYAAVDVESLVANDVDPDALDIKESNLLSRVLSKASARAYNDILEIKGKIVIGSEAEEYMDEVLALPPPMELNLSLPIYKNIDLPGTFVKDFYKCPPIRVDPDREPPKTVYDVRPSDLKIISGMGDSILAAFMANPRTPLVVDSVAEDRGASWAMGATVKDTLFNYLKVVTGGAAKGGSFGVHFPELCYGRICPFPKIIRWFHKKKDNLNFAFSGSMFSNMKMQAELLISAFKKREKKGLIKKEDWKFMTLHIGANDACVVCTRSPLFAVPRTTEDFKVTMIEVIELLRKNIPNLIINWMTMFRLSGIRSLTENNKYCKNIRFITKNIECPCAFTSEKTRAASDKMVDLWNEAMMEVYHYYNGRYDNFALVVDRGMGTIRLGELDPEFISNVDCFHPSIIGHSYLAKNVWNNLFLDFHDKTAYRSNSTVRIYCPTGEETIKVGEKRTKSKVKLL